MTQLDEHSQLITNFNFPPLKNLVIVSHSLDEAITRCIVDNKKNLDASITIVSLHELMTDYEISDEISDAGTCIKWIKGSEQHIFNNDHFLLNRVLYPSPLKVLEKLFEMQ